MKISLLAILLVATTVALGSSPSASSCPAYAATTVTLNPVADTYIDSLFPTSNFGGQNVLDVLKSPFGVDVAFLRFDLGSIPQTALISNAALRLHSDGVMETVVVGVHSVSNNSWDEMTTSFRNYPKWGNSSLDNMTLSSSSSAWYGWNVTSAIGAGSSVVSFAVVSESITQIGMVEFDSREGSSPPQLVVTYALQSSTSTTTSTSSPQTTGTPDNVFTDTVAAMISIVFLLIFVGLPTYVVVRLWRRRRARAGTVKQQGGWCKVIWRLL